jgi:hypothetical protein
MDELGEAIGVGDGLGDSVGSGLCGLTLAACEGDAVVCATPPELQPARANAASAVASLTEA